MIWTPILQSAGSFVSDPPPPFLEKRPKHMFLTSKKLREACIQQNGWIIGNSPNSLGSPPLFCGKYCEISVNMKWIFRDSGFADWFGIQDRQLQSLVNWNPTPRIGLSLVKSKLCTTAPAPAPPPDKTGQKHLTCFPAPESKQDKEACTMDDAQLKCSELSIGKLWIYI